RARSPVYASNPVHLEQYCASSANTGTSPAQRGMFRSCRLAWPRADRPPLLRFSPSVTPWSSKLGPTARHSALYARRLLAFKKLCEECREVCFHSLPSKLWYVTVAARPTHVPPRSAGPCRRTGGRRKRNRLSPEPYQGSTRPTPPAGRRDPPPRARTSAP